MLDESFLKQRLKVSRAREGPERLETQQRHKQGLARALMGQTCSKSSVVFPYPINMHHRRRRAGPAVREEAEAGVQVLSP